MDDYTKNVKPLVVKHIIIDQTKNKYIRRNHKKSELYNTFPTMCSKLYPMNRKEKRHFETERKIDLHGMTRNEAFNALLQCFDKCQSDGIKKLLVITGGNLLRNTTLRQSFLIWIKEDFGHYVISYSEANIRHGGQGAFYVILKRKF